jgi:hypothetical protein
MSTVRLVPTREGAEEEGEVIVIFPVSHARFACFPAGGAPIRRDRWLSRNDSP